jgi:hypothetical protein
MASICAAHCSIEELIEQRIYIAGIVVARNEVDNGACIEEAVTFRNVGDQLPRHNH